MSWIQNFPNNMSYAISAMLVASLLPFVFAWLSKVFGGFDFKKDNDQPREFLANTTGLSARLNAAQQNSFEGLPIFLASVLVAMHCFVPQNIVNFLAWFYVLLRIVYGVAYALNMAKFRSLIWALSLICCVNLFYLAIKTL